MKGLASVLGILLVVGLAIGAPTAARDAGRLDVGIGVGPTTAALDDINTAIVLFNTLIEHLNETLAVVPGVTGSVAVLDPLYSGMSVRATERYWVADWFALTGSFEYGRTETSTRGQYHGAETSTIDISAVHAHWSVLAGAHIQFLDVGLRLAAEASLGYFHSTFDHAVTFEVPSEYPDTIAGIPDEGEDRHSGSAVGLGAGLCLSYPLFEGVSVEARIGYRWADVPTLRNATATPLDFDSNGTTESADLRGLSLQIGLSLALDLSLGGEKGENP